MVAEGGGHAPEHARSVGHVEADVEPGLEVGLGLAVNLQLSVLGLATVGVVATDSSPGNLVDLQLAYTSADDAAAADPSGAPPALT